MVACQALTYPRSAKSLGSGPNLVRRNAKTRVRSHFLRYRCLLYSLLRVLEVLKYSIIIDLVLEMTRFSPYGVVLCACRIWPLRVQAAT